MNALFKYFNTQFFKHALFWSIVFLYFILSVSNFSMYANYRHLLESYGLIVIAQMIAAYTCIYVLMPKFLNQKKTGLFILSMLLLLMLLYTVYNACKVYYFDINYFEAYNASQQEYAQKSLAERLTNVPVFLSKCILFLTPTALLLMSRFYKNQQKFLKLNEQKKTAELAALRNQLNPHFLFNTLNNLYALTLDKSDKAPEVIERLSDILDYILYRCKDNYVPVGKELALMENYLGLEKTRYGERVNIIFQQNIDTSVKIAPLILLTFVENAFKHGVSQELKEATINISLGLENKDVVFSIVNSKPKGIQENEQNNGESLGIKNIEQQLELLYPGAYSLQIDEKEDSYSVLLKLSAK